MHSVENNPPYHYYRNQDFILDLEIYSHLENRLVFVFFDPWTIRQKKINAIVNSILAKGFKILLFNYKILNDSEVEQIYRKNPPITMKTAWHLPKEVYTMGESCGILFYHENPNCIASEVMKKIKGKSHPLLTNKGQIRYDFRAPNKSLSLMHSSDDWYSMLNECSPFFSKKTLMKSFNKFPFKEETSFFLCGHHESMEYVREQSATNLLLKLRIRIIDILLREGDTSTEGNLLKEFWIAKSEVDYLTFPVRKEVLEYTKIALEEHDLLEAFIQTLSSKQSYYFPRLYHNNCHTAEYVNALKMLHDINQYEYMDGDLIVKKLPIFYDQWEQLLFKTTLFHFNEFDNKLPTDPI
jgi:nucleoside diphosphate kinase